MKTMALRAAKKGMKAAKETCVDPFEVVSRIRDEHHAEVMLYHEEIEPAERAGGPKSFLLERVQRSQQLPLLIVEEKTLPPPRPVYFADAFSQGVFDASLQVGGVLPAYLTSMLVMFVHAMTRPEPSQQPSDLLDFEWRLGRLERAVLSAGTAPVEEKPRVVDWERLRVALSKAADALGWNVEWTVDQEKFQVLGRVAGVEYRELARHKLDFYEHIASAVDKDTFKAVSFELEPAE